jgi:prephenate dehydrogenase
VTLAGQRCLVLGGAGAVGGMFVDLLLADGADVCVVDIREPDRAVAFQRGDVSAPDPRLEAELRRADVVLLAVPEQVALAAVGRVAEALPEAALLADTTSVKSRIVAAVAECSRGLEAVSLNPMFAPSLGIAGRPVAAVVVQDGPRTQALLGLLRRHGGRVVEVGAEEHDRLTAATQALTHAAVLAFGLALDELDVDVPALRELAPPPHRTLLALLARIASGETETYWDVQAANPYAADARAALRGAARRLDRVVAAGDDAGFGATLERLRQKLGRDLTGYGALCAQVFRLTSALEER